MDVSIMSQLTITNAAFNHLHIYYDGHYLNDEVLSESDTFLPILLLLVEKTLADKVLMDEIVTYDLVFQKESLFYIDAKNVNIKEKDVLNNIVSEMKGVEVMIHLFDLLDSSNEEQKNYNVKRLCDYIRAEFCERKEGDIFDNKEHFEFLFNHIEIVHLTEEFLTAQRKNLKKITIFDQLGLIDAGTTQENTLVLAEVYPQLNGQHKTIFDELAALACAHYLSENPKINSIEAIDKNKALPVDELLLLGGILNHKVILNELANHLHCQSYQIVFDDSVYALREKLKLTATTRSFESSSTSTTWYKCAQKFAANLQLSEFIINLFSASIKHNKFDVECFVSVLVELPEQKIKAFIKLNEHGNSTVKTALASQQIQQSLNKKVIGQEVAVSSLCQGYLTSSIEAQQGPRLIYTFAGPSGVGKTYLATQLQSELNQYEKTGYVFNIFNMEQYSSERDASKLFGSGIQYTDASLGMLTSEVRAQPRQILLFDEIEKAHSIVVQSLLSILDSGITKDQTSQETIDFSQCIIIFTTNLGQDILRNNPQNTALSIFDLLQQSENPSNKTKLSPEFINRLAKGFPILFSELKVNHLVRLAEMQVNELDSSSAYISYKWPHNFASLMLQSMSPDISVRGLKSNFAKHKSMLLSRAIPYFTEESQQVKFQVNIEQTEDAGTTPTQLLLLDDDSKVFEQVKAHQADCEIALCADIEGLRLAIESCHPDALLIDIDTINKSSLQLSDVISELFERNDKTPIFTYHLVEQGDKQAKPSLAHEVREHFCINLNDFTFAFANMLTRVDYYLDTEHKLSNMKRRSEQLQYRCEVTQHEGVFYAIYKQLSVTQLVKSIDLKEGDLFKHSLPTLKLDDVVGLDRAKNRLADVVNWLKSPEKLANFGVKIPSGFLFAGPPGTGKTFLAKALAGESGLPFFSVSSSELSDKHAGGTTQNIKKLFATARKYAPAIIFIDEIDAIAGKRSSFAQGADRDRNLTVNALLTEMDGFTAQSDPIFILAATNHPQLLDSAIVRPGRFDETIYCDLPNVEARKQFFTGFAEKHQIIFTQEEVIQLVSSSQGMSSAEIEQVFRESIYQAVGESKALTSEEIKQTMIRVSYGLPSDYIILSTQEKQRTAYHEAGHLLLSKLLFPKQPIDFVTIEPRNNALGFVATRAADEYESLSSIRVKHRLEMLLAGRVAEKIYTGNVDEISSGASGDIEKATQLAMHAIYEGGLDASVGPVNVALLTKFEESDLLLKAQQAVLSWLQEAEKSVEARLIEHRAQLDHIANTLIEKESLIGEEINALFL
jgi:cell division protease FtsH